MKLNRNTEVESLHVSPPDAKPVLPAVPSSVVYNEDCVEALKRFNDKYFDLAIVDPPYGIDMGNKINSVTGGVKHIAKDWDKYTPTQEYWDELFRIS